MTGSHHRGRYTAYRKQLMQLAAVTPDAVCWRDGLTLAQHPPHRDGTPAKWTAGHTVDGDPHAMPWLHPTRQPPAGSWLALEASTCNYANGARRTNKFRANPQSRRWT